MSLPTLIINGISILMPTNHGWSPPQSLGTGGSGNEVIPGIWKYPMAWDLMYAEDFNALWEIWYNNQGTLITAQLPEIGALTYSLKTYSCVINPVISRGFFQGAYQGVSTMLAGIDITIP
jgi:hypothetical protein